MAGQTTVPFFSSRSNLNLRYGNCLSCQNTNTKYHQKKITTGKKGTVVWLCWNTCQNTNTNTMTGKKLRPEEKRYSRLAYTICNTRNIWILLCLYLKGGNTLNLGIGWFEGKAPSRTYKTCLTMMVPFAGPSSMAMGNQPMPSRYPLCKRLYEGRLQGFLLTLWSGGVFFFLVNTSILY